MNVVHVPWSAVLPWSVVLDPTGHPAVVLPGARAALSVASGPVPMIGLMRADGQVCAYPMPDGCATVLEPDLGAAVRNLLNAGFTLEMLDG